MLRLGGFLAVLLLFGAACSGEAERTPPVESGGSSSTQPDGSNKPGDFPASLRAGWKTDFTKASVRPDELISGGPGKDGIPALSSPKLLSVSEVSFLSDREPVIAFGEGVDVRAYPLQILTWHEIVNDVVAGRPVLITFCPLCNTAIAFDRTVNGRALDFGVSGFLRNSDLVMFDRETESWWQQVTGEALVGELTGTRLELLPSSIVSWADFKSAFPQGKVLSRDTGHSRDYGRNPYAGYDDINSSPFLFDGKTDSRLAPMERVVTVQLGADVVAYPFSRLEKQPVVADTVGDTEIVVLFKRGTASALDLSTIADSRDIGSAAVFSAVLEERKLSFRAEGSAFIDNETGSRWDIFGRATAGTLKGMALEPVVSGNHFWFAWAAFKPETHVWSP